MGLPVWVEQVNGHFTATLLGAPQVRAEGGSRDAALAALRAQVGERQMAGQLLFVDIEPAGVLGLAELARRHENDPGWHEMWDRIKEEAYRERDEEKAREFPE